MPPLNKADIWENSVSNIYLSILILSDDFKDNLNINKIDITFPFLYQIAIQVCFFLPLFFNTVQYVWFWRLYLFKFHVGVYTFKRLYSSSIWEIFPCLKIWHLQQAVLKSYWSNVLPWMSIMWFGQWNTCFRKLTKLRTFQHPLILVLLFKFY